MAYCTKCGKELKENEQHVCVNEPSINKTSSLDRQTISELLKNPLRSLHFEERDLVYGITGMIASVLGFFIWGVAYVSQIQSTIERAMGNGIAGIFVRGIMNRSVVNSSIDFNLFLTGLISLLLSTGFIFMFGNWLGTKKQTLKRGIVILGSAQWAFGVGFLLAGLVAFVSLKLSFLLMVIVAISDFVLMHLIGLEMFGVQQNRYLTFVGGSSTAYIIVFFLIIDSISSSMISSMIGGFMQ